MSKMFSFFSSIQEKFSSFNPRQRVSFIVTVIALLLLPVTLIAVRYQQNLSSRAESTGAITVLDKNGTPILNGGTTQEENVKLIITLPDWSGNAHSGSLNFSSLLLPKAYAEGTGKSCLQGKGKCQEASTQDPGYEYCSLGDGSCDDFGSYREWCYVPNGQCLVESSIPSAPTQTSGNTTNVNYSCNGGVGWQGDSDRHPRNGPGGSDTNNSKQCSGAYEPIMDANGLGTGWYCYTTCASQVNPGTGGVFSPTLPVATVVPTITSTGGCAGVNAQGGGEQRDASNTIVAYCTGYQVKGTIAQGDGYRYDTYCDASDATINPAQNKAINNYYWSNCIPVASPNIVLPSNAGIVTPEITQALSSRVTQVILIKNHLGKFENIDRHISIYPTQDEIINKTVEFDPFRLVFGENVITVRFYPRKDIEEANRVGDYQELSITIHKPQRQMSFDDSLDGLSQMRSDEVPGTLDDYWNGKAEWKLVRKYTQANMRLHADPDFLQGIQFRVVDGVWYLFSRKPYYSDRNSDKQFTHAECSSYLQLNDAAFVTLGVIVRKSTDKGVTWSDPVTILTPELGKAWECSSSDGSAFYDAHQDKWHYMFQCMDRNGKWSGCHVEREGKDPMGQFSQSHVNPVINGGGEDVPGDLWKRICTDSSKKCYRIAGGNVVHEEGTFDIFEKDSAGYFYVAFHGFKDPYGFRGIAKTRDFITWIAGNVDEGVPNDAILSKEDSQIWREKWKDNESIGMGAGSILRQNRNYYLFAEGADVNLGCTLGQNWNWGIFRTNNVTSSQWEQYPNGNPIFYSNNETRFSGSNNSQFIILRGACDPQYGGLFFDPTTGKTYLNISRESKDRQYFGLYLYELVRQENLLKNGSFWKCTSDDWNTSGSTLTVSRYFEFSSDGNCHAVLSCSNAQNCNASSMTQSIDVSQISSRNISFGGKFGTQAVSSPSPTVELLLSEFDENSVLLNKTSQRIELSKSYPIKYSSFINTLTLGNRTKRLEYRVTPSTNDGYLFDELFVNVQ